MTLFPFCFVPSHVIGLVVTFPSGIQWAPFFLPWYNVTYGTVSYKLLRTNATQLTRAQL